MKKGIAGGSHCLCVASVARFFATGSSGSASVDDGFGAVAGGGCGGGDTPGAGGVDVLATVGGVGGTAVEVERGGGGAGGAGGATVGGGS